MAADGIVADSTQLCWAHVLAQAQGTILFPEEWNYIQTAQAEPLLETNYTLLKEASSKHKDFAMLHTPLTKFLFAAFDRVLQARKQDLVKRVAMDSVPANIVVGPHEFTAAVVQAAVGADHVCLTGAAFNSKNVVTAADTLAEEGGHVVGAHLRDLQALMSSFDSTAY